MTEDLAPPDPPQSNGFKSFSLTVRKRTTIEVTALPQHDSDEETADTSEPRRAQLTHFEDGVMVTDEGERTKKGALVIKPVMTLDWRFKQLQEKEENGTITDEERARLALMLEASGIAPQSSTTEKITIDNSDKVPDDPDYGQVKIEDFGLAFLRGFGFKEDEGIGKTNKQVVQPSQNKRRIKNLGLGATISEEDLKNIKVGSKIFVMNGSSKGKYGIVESLDSDNSACYVKLALSKQIVRLSQFHIKIVSSKEYEKNSKVINQEAYDYARERIEAEQLERNGRNGISLTNGIKRESSSRQKHERKRSRSRSPTPIKPWACENLRVRVISKDYKGGDYYKTKMIVVEAGDRNRCLLKDDDGRRHELKEKYIETVIPRGRGGKVMVLTGKYHGSVGRIVERDDDKYKIWVNLVECDELVKVDFDDACEYVGYVQDLDLHDY